jgi:hypothetical protein
LLNSFFQVASGAGGFILEKMLEHMDNRRGSAWRHSLPSAPGVDFLDRHRSDLDVDICGFLWHGEEVGCCRACPLDNLGQKFDRKIGLYAGETSPQNTRRGLRSERFQRLVVQIIRLVPGSEDGCRPKNGRPARRAVKRFHGRVRYCARGSATL